MTPPPGPRAGATDGRQPPPPPWLFRPPSRRADRPAVNALLFALTAGSIYLAGGPWLALALMAILLAHEMGHYLTCRRYGVDASLPYFIPLPFLSLVGTLGAFIRIRAPIPDRRALLDIGLLGPLAGFVVCLPVLVLGIREAHWSPIVEAEGIIYFGEPLLFQWATAALKGPAPDGATLAVGPLGLAAWFGLLVTALNLMPIGQLDGGHVSYALFGAAARHVSRAAFALCLVLVYLRPTWLLWAALMLLLGRRHPPTLHDRRPIGPTRLALGLLGFLVFAVSFTPNPILVSWSELSQAVGLTSR